MKALSPATVLAYFFALQHLAAGLVDQNQFALYCTLLTNRDLPPVLDIGQRRWIAYEQFELHRIDERRWALHHKDGRSHLFEQLHSGQWRLTLTELRDRTGQHVQLQLW